MTPVRTYTNPVTHLPSADPFVLKHAGEYWAYVTGEWDDGRCFGILHSTDLVDWQPLRGALAHLEPPPGMQYTCYWAPEVTYENGVFYLYYSVGDEEHMHIRVATSLDPAGPFNDSGHRLTQEKFAIDAHVFVDDDGSRHLFYAADFLDHTHIGTGVVVDRMLDPFTLEGKPHPAARARYDWQVYDPNRAAKGGVRWHTVEGPFVLKRKGRYYLMFSGGNWQNDTYGLAYAVSREVDSSAEWQQPVDGVQTLPVLKSDHARGVIGPGHNSVVRGPDNRQLYCVYHRWDRERGARVMAIDPLEWAGSRLLVIGPSTGAEEIAQPPARYSGSFDGMHALELPAQPFLSEVSLRPADVTRRLRIALRAGEEDLLALEISEGQLTATTPYGRKTAALAQGFRLHADHLLRLEVNQRLASLSFNGRQYQWSGLLPALPTALALEGEAGGTYRAFALTPGWEDSFEYELTPAELGWEDALGQGDWVVRGGELLQADSSAGETRLEKALPFEVGAGYELVFNARLESEAGAWVVHPAASAAEAGPGLWLTRAGSGWALTAGQETWGLPADFDARTHQHFRLRCAGGAVRVLHEGQLLGSLPVPAAADRVALGTRGGAAAFDLVRVSPL